MLNILRTSIGGIGQMIVAMTAWIFLLRILAEVGTHAVSASTIAIRIMMFTLMPAWGMSNAAATLVGQNLGANEPARAEAAVWRTGLYNMIYLILVSVVFFVFNDRLIANFTTDAHVIAIGGEWLRILSYSYIVYGWWMVSVQAFNGAGDIWGDTVNMASRLEGTSEAGKIQVSEVFASFLASARNDSPSHTASSEGTVNPSRSPERSEGEVRNEAPGTWHLALRGDIELKGKGTVTTYWLDHHLLPPSA